MQSHLSSSSALIDELEKPSNEFDLRRVRPLLRDPTQVNALVGGTRTPLSVAVVARLSSAVRLLLAAKPDNLLLPLIECIRMPNRDADTLALLLQSGAPLNERCAVTRLTPLLAAVHVADVALVSLLRQYGADVQFDDSCALHAALERDDESLVNALLADVEPSLRIAPSTQMQPVAVPKRPAEDPLPTPKTQRTAADTPTSTDFAALLRRLIDATAAEPPPPPPPSFASASSPPRHSSRGPVPIKWRPGMAVERFFADYPPSTTDYARVTWIYALSDQDVDRNEDASGAAAEFARDRARGLPVTAEYMVQLAKRYRVLCGKWLVFAKSDAIDSIWRLAVRRRRPRVHSQGEPARSQQQHARDVRLRARLLRRARRATCARAAAHAVQPEPPTQLQGGSVHVARHFRQGSEAVRHCRDTVFRIEKQKEVNQK